MKLTQSNGTTFYIILYSTHLKEVSKIVKEEHKMIMVRETQRVSSTHSHFHIRKENLET